MQIQMAFKLLVSCGFREVFITNDYPFGDLVLFDEGFIENGFTSLSSKSRMPLSQTLSSEMQ